MRKHLQHHLSFTSIPRESHLPVPGCRPSSRSAHNHVRLRPHNRHAKLCPLLLRMCIRKSNTSHSTLQPHSRPSTTPTTYIHMACQPRQSTRPDERPFYPYEPRCSQGHPLANLILGASISPMSKTRDGEAIYRFDSESFHPRCPSCTSTSMRFDLSCFDNTVATRLVSCPSALPALRRVSLF